MLNSESQQSVKWELSRIQGEKHENSVTNHPHSHRAAVDL